MKDSRVNPPQKPQLGVYYFYLSSLSVPAQTKVLQSFTLSASHLVAVVWGRGVDKLDPFGLLHESFLPELWQRSLMKTKK